ncbi:hypothetical protein COL0001_15040 [Helicobacter pylori]
MRQTNETATSFNQLKEITQSMQALKNANVSGLTHQEALKPKGRTQAKKGVLKPKKRAFSERQKTTIRNQQQEAQSLKTEQANQKGANND